MNVDLTEAWSFQIFACGTLITVTGSRQGAGIRWLTGLRHHVAMAGGAQQLRLLKTQTYSDFFSSLFQTRNGPREG